MRILAHVWRFSVVSYRFSFSTKVEANIAFRFKSIIACHLGKSITKQERNGMFEGDIVLTEETKKIVEGENTFDAIASQAKKWPGATVPYVFDYYFGGFNLSPLSVFY